MSNLWLNGFCCAAYLLISMSFGGSGFRTVAFAAGESTEQNSSKDDFEIIGNREYSTTQSMAASSTTVFNEFRANAKLTIRFAKPNSISTCEVSKAFGITFQEQRTVKCESSQKLPIELNDQWLGPQSWRVRYTVDGNTRDRTFFLVPPDFPSFKASGRGVNPQDFVFSMSRPPFGFLVVLDNSGRLLFFRRVDSAVIDFRPHVLADGSVLYSYLKITYSNPEINAMGLRVILDRNFQFIQTLPHEFDSHDFEMYSKDHYAGIYYEAAINKKGTPYLDVGVREYKKGKLVYQIGIEELIRAGLFYQNIRILTFRGKVLAVPMHLNTFKLFGNERILMNFTPEGTIMWNRKTKEIEWTIGNIGDDFGVPRDLAPRSSHQPTYDEKNSALTIFDNGDARVGSRVLNYKFNPQKKGTSLAQIIYQGNYHSSSMGGVEFQLGALPQTAPLTISFGDHDISTPAFIEAVGLRETFKLVKSSREYMAYRVYRFNTKLTEGRAPIQ